MRHTLSARSTTVRRSIGVLPETDRLGEEWLGRRRVVGVQRQRPKLGVEGWILIRSGSVARHPVERGGEARDDGKHARSQRWVRVESGTQVVDRAAKERHSRLGFKWRHRREEVIVRRARGIRVSIEQLAVRQDLPSGRVIRGFLSGGLRLGDCTGNIVLGLACLGETEKRRQVLRVDRQRRLVVLLRSRRIPLP